MIFTPGARGKGERNSGKKTPERLEVWGARQDKDHEQGTSKVRKDHLAIHRERLKYHKSFSETRLGSDRGRARPDRIHSFDEDEDGPRYFEDEFWEKENNEDGTRYFEDELWRKNVNQCNNQYHSGLPLMLKQIIQNNI